MTLKLAEKTFLSDSFLQLLGGPKSNLLRCLDLDWFTGGRVAAHAGSALAHLQNSETDDANPLALLQMLGDACDHVVQDALGLFLGKLLMFRDCGCQMLERDG